MDKWFQFSTEALLAIVSTSIGIYISVVLLTRIGGKRSFSKMSSFDFAITVAIGSMIATTVLSKSVSLWDGITGLAILYLIQLVTAYLRRYKHVQDITDNKPLLLMEGSKILYDNLKKARVTESDLKAKLREANVLELPQIRAVIFESTGDIAVLHTKDESQKVEDYIMDDVRRI